MFNFEDLEREISEQNAALESLLAELENEEIANESLFKNSVTVDDLLEKVKAAVEKCESCEDCEKLLDKLKDEEDKFNKCFEDMKEAAKKFKDGKIDKEELNKVIVAANEEIKKCCDLLALRDVDENADELKDADIKLLRDFLVKSREVIEEKCESFGDSDSDSDDEEEIDEDKAETEEKSEKEEKEDSEDKEEEAAEESTTEVEVEENAVEETVEEVATESAEVAGQVGIMVMYAALLALAAKCSPEGKERKYLTKLNKELKPALKAAKKELRKAKLRGDYNAAISACKEAIKIHEVMLKEAESLAREVHVATTKDSDGKTHETIQKRFGMSATEFKSKSLNEIEKYKADIKLFELKKRKKDGYSASDLAEKAHESYMEGYMKALEDFGAFDDEDDDLEETVEETIEE